MALLFLKEFFYCEICKVGMFHIHCQIFKHFRLLVHTFSINLPCFFFYFIVFRDAKRTLLVPSYKITTFSDAKNFLGLVSIPVENKYLSLILPAGKMVLNLACGRFDLSLAIIRVMF